MSERVYLLPLWVRLWHWTNALLIITLTITGISLHFADPKLPLVEFSLAARIHDIAGLALVAAYAFFAVANIVSGNWWQYVPKPPGIIDRCMVQARWYLWGIFQGEPHPYPVTKEVNFNAMQALVYWFIMYIMMPTLLVTGLVFMFPQFAPEHVFGMDGLLPVAVLHYLTGTAIVLFMIAHMYLGTTGHTVTTMFKTMITGWHEH
ncbi:cytochrome b/b6 domain-containing protein [Sulfuritalea sp.]|uniref:cytochrome b/b6 domain-containing protein n=1 Tax=Sulfuritalea sp. TaxID=2480090 RepID=UPI001AC6E624|nr:cytochrome b/b6 domain-containing protein [Sulfuritalea sp.]MBN8475487.1 cytochrome b/b6 domain-containing protein [Sulfuritalea sp.]